MNSPSRDLLQPSLLDRLTDEATGRHHAGPEKPYLGREALKRAVLRDLEWLLNARSDDFEDEPENRSVLSYGMPALAGKTATTLDINWLEKTVRDLIVSFEPRINPTTLKVKALFQEVLMNRHNLVGLEIHGQLWAKPYPIELLLRTELDLETGHVAVHSR